MRKLPATSLLEVIIAIGITSTAIYGGLQASIKGINTIRDLENRNNAALLLEEIANRIQTNNRDAKLGVNSGYDKQYTKANLLELQSLYTNQDITKKNKALCYLYNIANYDYCVKDMLPKHHILPTIHMTEWLTNVTNSLPNGDGIVCIPKANPTYAELTSPTLTSGCSTIGTTFPNTTIPHYLAKIKWTNSNNDINTQYVRISVPQYQMPVAAGTKACNSKMTTKLKYTISTDQSAHMNPFPPYVDFAGFNRIGIEEATLYITITTDINCNGSSSNSGRTVFDTPFDSWVSPKMQITNKYYKPFSAMTMTGLQTRVTGYPSNFSYDTMTTLDPNTYIQTLYQYYYNYRWTTVYFLPTQKIIEHFRKLSTSTTYRDDFFAGNKIILDQGTYFNCKDNNAYSYCNSCILQQAIIGPIKFITDCISKCSTDCVVQLPWQLTIQKDGDSSGALDIKNCGDVNSCPILTYLKDIPQ